MDIERLSTGNNNGESPINFHEAKVIYLPFSPMFNVLIFQLASGDHDMLIPHVGTEGWIYSFNMTVVDNWRPWFVDGQIAGSVSN